MKQTNQYFSKCIAMLILALFLCAPVKASFTLKHRMGIVELPAGEGQPIRSIGPKEKHNYSYFGIYYKKTNITTHILVFKFAYINYFLYLCSRNQKVVL